MRLLVCVLPFVSKLASASAPPPAIQNGLSRTAPALLRHTRFYPSTTTSLTAFPGAIRPMSATTNGTNAKTVMQPATRCLLCCSGEQRHEPIQLPATELFHLGRTAETQIKDVFCARRQGKHQNNGTCVAMIHAIVISISCCNFVTLLNC